MIGLALRSVSRISFAIVDDRHRATRARREPAAPLRTCFCRQAAASAWPPCCGRSSTPTAASRRVSYSARRSTGWESRCRGRGAPRGNRRRPARLLQLPCRPLDEAALYQPARAVQPRDRPAHRRRRDFPQRPLPDPARHQRRDRAKRRVARRPPLPQQPLAGDSARSEKRNHRQRRGPRTHSSMNQRRVTPI